MRNYFFFIFFSILSADSVPLSGFSFSGRRILHQPFFPLDPPQESPPISTPSPPSPVPKVPFSSNSPPDSPFFPSYVSPPPPPSPASFASFPANISSLIVPQAKKSRPDSRKLLIVAISSVISAAVVAGILVFLYCRRREQDGDFSVEDSKTFTSDSSRRVGPQRNGSGNSKLRANSANTSSEFLYLGTLVNSRGIDSGSDRRNENVRPASSRRKLESPELRPLSFQSFRRNPDVGSIGEDEEDEEFYSPKASPKSLSRDGSESRRAFAAVPVKLAGEEKDKASSDVCSSNSTESPASSPEPTRDSPEKGLDISGPIPRSPSLSLISMSPDLTFERNPRDLDRSVNSPSFSSISSSSSGEDAKKSTDESFKALNDLDPIRRSSSPSSATSPSSSPDRDLNEHQDTYLHSSASSSPARGFHRSPDATPMLANDLRQSLKSPVLSSISSSPGKELSKNPNSSPAKILQSPSLSSSSSSVSSSPERSINKFPVGSPSYSVQHHQSASSSSLSSSPERDFKSPDASPKPSNVSVEILQSLGSVDLISNNSAPAMTRRPPPPPPPPPPRRLWGNQSPRTPTDQAISRPPPLVPPSRPFVIQNQTPSMVSPMELPQSSDAGESTEETPKTKLKALHWDKVRASSDREMVWDHLRSSSFKLNEEMIETLFIAKTPDSKPKQITPRSVLQASNQENRVLDPKRAQNIAILLRALNVTIDEVCEALLEGNADGLGTELLESLMRMAPTKEEERKLKEYQDDSPAKLGAPEKFLKAVLDVPFAFKRVEALLYVANFDSEVEYLKKSFETLEAACEELRNSRMFLKLLEAVLKTGNRMNVGTNRGDAHAFKLDTLHKLVDVKGADGKTTLLHFVVQEIIRTEGARLSDNNQNDETKCRKLGLEVVSGLSSELTNVKKAAAMDSEVLSSEVTKLSIGKSKIIEVVQTMGSDEINRRFTESMNVFLKTAEEDFIRVQALESVALSLVKEITEYFHGNSAKEEAHPFRIFMVVRDFLGILDRVCREVGMINERTIVSSAHKFPVPVNPMLPQPLPGLYGRRQSRDSDEDTD